jgi:Tol biopolymer transport system component
VQLTRNGGWDPQESEDGRSIYYYFQRTLRKVSVDGGGDTVLFEGLSAFTVTHGGIYYSSPAPDMALWFQSIAGGKPRRIMKLTGSTIPGVSPDEHWLLYSRMDRPDGSDLMLVENFH